MELLVFVGVVVLWGLSSPYWRVSAARSVVSVVFLFALLFGIGVIAGHWF